MGEAGGEGMGNLRGTPMASTKNIQFQKAKVSPSDLFVARNKLHMVIFESMIILMP
jgi:hypothetical protein